LGVLLLDDLDRLLVVVAMNALMPSLIDDQLGAGRPPFRKKTALPKLPVVPAVGDAQRVAVRVTPISDLLLQRAERQF
jgi:hypothetical protein